jgi:hypothetical protein
MAEIIISIMLIGFSCGALMGQLIAEIVNYLSEEIVSLQDIAHDELDSKVIKFITSKKSTNGAVDGAIAGLVGIFFFHHIILAAIIGTILLLLIRIPEKNLKKWFFHGFVGCIAAITPCVIMQEYLNIIR